MAQVTHAPGGREPQSPILSGKPDDDDTFPATIPIFIGAISIMAAIRAMAVSGERNPT